MNDTTLIEAYKGLIEIKKPSKAILDVLDIGFITKLESGTYYIAAPYSYYETKGKWYMTGNFSEFPKVVQDMAKDMLNFAAKSLNCTLDCSYDI